ncbi:MAG: GIY-YIG nuclease family protein [Acutalibacteraceae bacterium]
MKDEKISYELVSVNFELCTRKAKIEFSQITQYRTIERYVTRDYEKFPIYSDWKFKRKTIIKSIKLTNAELESLNIHSDYLIREFSYQIILQINNKELFPSWFILDSLKKEYEEKVGNINQCYDEYEKSKEEQIIKNNNIIKNNEDFIQQKENILLGYKEEEIRISKKISNIIIKNKSIFLSLITFGIYSYYISEKRKSKLNNSLLYYQTKISEIEKEISEYKKCNEKLLLEIKNLNELITNDEKERLSLIYRQKIILKQESDKVQSLQNTYNENNDSFTLLKAFVGLKYEKIIGCYIIHNREKDKYYVGQSKDVLKRLKQHFRGTVPNNIIFAEDYYSSSYSNKEDLFEVKIIPCETKDELDRTEKYLIEKYDAWNSGYNRTSGNN